MTLRLEGLEVDCIIGDRPEERVRMQRLRIDAALEIPDTVGETDALADTVDYAALAEKIRAALVWAKCRMIERAAKIVCDACLADARVLAATVRVTKPGAVPHLAAASAEYAGRRS